MSMERTLGRYFSTYNVRVVLADTGKDLVSDLRVGADEVTVVRL